MPSAKRPLPIETYPQDVSDEDTENVASDTLASPSRSAEDDEHPTPSPTRRSARKRKFVVGPSFKGMQGGGKSEHYKLGIVGGAYRGRKAMKKAPKSAVFRGGVPRILIYGTLRTSPMYYISLIATLGIVLFVLHFLTAHASSW